MREMSVVGVRVELPANQPIVALIPDDRIFVRFFVPQADITSYRVGRKIRFGCDGCGEGLTATISYVSPRPEFTPLVIYSRESRDRLVFMVEAVQVQYAVNYHPV